MKKEIKYSTSEQQPEKLLSQHLIINNRKHALIGLKLFRYSSLIKSYRDPYILKINNTVYYRDGISFEQISSLYFFDKAIRNTVIVMSTLRILHTLAKFSTLILPRKILSGYPQKVKSNIFFHIAQV